MVVEGAGGPAAHGRRPLIDQWPARRKMAESRTREPKGTGDLYGRPNIDYWGILAECPDRGAAVADHPPQGVYFIFYLFSRSPFGLATNARTGQKTEAGETATSNPDKNTGARGTALLGSAGRCNIGLEHHRRNRHCLPKQNPGGEPHPSKFGGARGVLILDL